MAGSISRVSGESGDGFVGWGQMKWGLESHGRESLFWFKGNFFFSMQSGLFFLFLS